jgi:hypothetical protein
MGLGRVLIVIAACAAFEAPAQAAVERVEVLERIPFAAGTAFGDAGAYEKIRGIAHFALDPEAPPMRRSST